MAKDRQPALGCAARALESACRQGGAVGGSVSPDGKQLVVSTDDGTEAAVCVYDLAGTTAMRKLTFGGGNRFPLWTRDGQRVVFYIRSIFASPPPENSQVKNAYMPSIEKSAWLIPEHCGVGMLYCGFIVCGRGIQAALTPRLQRLQIDRSA